MNKISYSDIVTPSRVIPFIIYFFPTFPGSIYPLPGLPPGEGA